MIDRPGFRKAHSVSFLPARAGSRPGIRAVQALAPLAWCIAAGLHAQSAPPPQYTQSDFGGVGLLQTPTARMDSEGQASFVYSRVDPYTKLNVSVQPFSWLEASARYTIVSNKPYLADPTSHQSYKDKSVDAKIHLRDETRWLPEMAIGIRDLAGTGLFSSEYVVASKRVGPLDLSLGLAWGNLGARGNLPNPLGWIDGSFNHRPVGDVSTGATTGQFTAARYFHGRTALFGGVEYQTPLKWLRLKAELDGNDYKHEVIEDTLPQRWPVNLGAVFRVNRFFDVSLGYERGNTYMLSFTVSDNLGQRTEAAKPLDPPPEPVRGPDTGTGVVGQQAATPMAVAPPAAIDWTTVSAVLEDNAGIKVNHIARRGPELLVYGESTRFFYGPQSLGRATRILHNRLDASIEWITFIPEDHGLPIVEDSVHRSKFVAYLDHDLDLPALRRSVEQDPPTIQSEDVLYVRPRKKLELGLSPGFYASLGGPNAPILYQFSADGSGTFHFNDHLWVDGEVDVNLLNNYQNYTYDAPSKLPRVRTDVRKYLVSSDVTIPNLQLTGALQLDTNLYGMAYAGMLESMFGGVGGEVLYRPLDQRWAFGVDANFVRQRGFKQDFSFRKYQVATGHATLYLDTGWDGLHTALSAGRYLAGDWGTTIDFSREFANGVRMGAYATFTTAGKRYGEGSFDKGFYLSVPFDLFMPWSRNRRASIQWQPLLRDGGAKLNKSYSLYEMTDPRDGYLFDQNLDKISH